MIVRILNFYKYKPIKYRKMSSAKYIIYIKIVSKLKYMCVSECESVCMK